jgi:ATP-dependent protease ClpP protease subunit
MSGDNNGRQDLAVQLFEVQLEAMLDRGIDLVGRSVQLIGEIDEDTFKFIDGALTMLENQNRKSITIKIVSGGGDIYSALAIISRMRASQCKIITEGHGYVMSAATAILAAGNKRRLSSLATFMWHEASYEVGGKHAEVKAWIEQFDKEEERWAELMAQFSNETALFWADSAKHTDKFFTPKELIELGVIDESF